MGIKFRRTEASQEEQAEKLVTRGEYLVKRGLRKQTQADDLFKRAVRSVEGYGKEAELHIRIAALWDKADPKTEFTQFSKANNLNEAAMLTPSPAVKEELFARAAIAFYQVKNDFGTHTALWEAGTAWAAAGSAAENQGQSGRAVVFRKRAENMFLQHLHRVFEGMEEVIPAIAKVIEYASDPVERVKWDMVREAVRPSQDN